MLAPDTRYYRPQPYRYRNWKCRPHSLRQTYVSYVAHTILTFQNITPLTLCFEMCETNYRLETIGVSATVLTVETGKWTTGIGADGKISIGRYRYPPILASIGRYPIPDTGIGLTLVVVKESHVKNPLHSRIQRVRSWFITIKKVMPSRCNLHMSL